MFLTITTTHQPATDLGYLLHKHPGKAQSFAQSFGTAHVFYPEASEARCTAALYVEIDPIGLVRRERGGEFTLGQYVNDRPYAASSLLSVALGEVFRTAINGQCRDRPELVDTALPLEAMLSALDVGTLDLAERLFVPLGYQVRSERLPLDRALPAWGESRYARFTLSGTVRLRDLLSHLYVLIPVLDDEKHYWVGDDEVEKLLRHGGEWLSLHPEQKLIASRYLKRRKNLVREALERLSTEESVDDMAPEQRDAREAALEKPISLAEQRVNAVLSALAAAGADSIVDLGCGEGRLLRALLEDSKCSRVLGMDVSQRALDYAADRLRLDRMPERKRARLNLIQGSLTYRDARLEGYDAAAAVEVIEHLEPHRLDAFERIVFAHARPKLAIITTPNVEYNVRFEGLRAGAFRHPDHRFEWTRAEFAQWARAVAERHGYGLTLRGIGDLDPELGTPTQMALFTVK